MIGSTLNRHIDDLHTQGNYYVGKPNPANFNDNDYASQTLAHIKRQQWADYQAKYPAIHAEFLDMAMNPDFTLEQVGRVQGNVDRAFARADDNRKATLSRMGVADTTQRDGISQALAVAQGENATRQHGKTRQLNAIGGSSLPNLQTQGG